MKIRNLLILSALSTLWGSIVHLTVIARALAPCQRFCHSSLIVPVTEHLQATLRQAMVVFLWWYVQRGREVPKGREVYMFAFLPLSPAAPLLSFRR